ncbi:MAG: hypothetical protein IJ848_00220 [Alphaproteobacteria bacterium]|nr:hypothetical protein [Alphaproteobacteria bacterium]
MYNEIENDKIENKDYKSSKSHNLDFSNTISTSASSIEINTSNCCNIEGNTLNTIQNTCNNIITNIQPHPYEPREILYIDEWDNCEYNLKLNVIQFSKYNFNKFTIPISKYDKYYKKQNAIFKKEQSILTGTEETQDISLEFYKNFYVKKDQDFYYYINLLAYLLKGSDKLYHDVNTGLYNNNELFKYCNYANQYDIEFTFDIFIENICNAMKTSKLIKDYDLTYEINEFRLGLQRHIDNTERRQEIWDDFLSYIY